jgi:hypothetical protein
MHLNLLLLLLVCSPTAPPRLLTTRSPHISQLGTCCNLAYTASKQASSSKATGHICCDVKCNLSLTLSGSCMSQSCADLDVAIRSAALWGELHHHLGQRALQGCPGHPNMRVRISSFEWSPRLQQMPAAETPSKYAEAANE